MSRVDNEQQRVCGNCILFKIEEDGITATDVQTSKQIKYGTRDCSAKNIAWADCPCPTGKFTPNPQ